MESPQLKEGGSPALAVLPITKIALEEPSSLTLLSVAMVVLEVGRPHNLCKSPSDSTAAAVAATRVAQPAATSHAGSR